MSRAAPNGIGGHHSARSRTDIWLTPPHILTALGSFDLDPCAATLRPWDTAETHYTTEDNGLAKPWNGRVWLNPPYQSSVIGTWLGRLAEHDHGTALIFARTETKAFFNHVWNAASGLLFLSGRLNFHTETGIRAAKSSGAPSVLCAYGDEDTEILAGCDLDGAFVPLRLSGLVRIGSIGPGTWADEIAAVMRDLDGPISLSDLYRIFARHRKSETNPNYRAKIRQQLQRGAYRRVAPGLWETQSGAMT